MTTFVLYNFKKRRHALSKYPTKVACKFKGKAGDIVLDQIRTVDRKRMVKKLGSIDSTTQRKTIVVPQETFTL
jgi:mRNA interferase MazF